jgi:NAD(P)-dependent dehydrogenase (short-subunit alcohol dehydrogenase family)
MTTQRPLALVTGGSRRVGAAIVEALAMRGADVVIHFHRPSDDAEALCDRVRKMGSDAWMIKADLRSEAETESLIRRASGRAGRPVSILVNNASSFPPSTPKGASWHDVEESLRVHHWAPLILMRSLADQLVFANVVNILDATTPQHDLDHFAYQVGKSALDSLTRVMARALAPTIRVNAVSPGAILQPEGADEEYLDEIAKNLPLMAHGSPQDIGNAVAYLAHAPFVTGATLHVDGGAHLLGGAHV